MVLLNSRSRSQKKFTDGVKATTNGTVDQNNFSKDAYNHISCFYEELQTGNLAALRHCKVKIVDFGNACYIVCSNQIFVKHI